VRSSSTLELYAPSCRPNDLRVSELNILSLAFLSVEAGNYAIAILHLDHNQNLQLLARDLILPSANYLMNHLCFCRQLFFLLLLTPTEVSPCLVTVHPRQSSGKKVPIPGGILVLGGRKIRYFELSSAEWQEKTRERQQKLESQKKNADRSLGGNAKEQAERTRDKEAKGEGHC
jgi:DNA damage-binding protein 1